MTPTFQERDRGRERRRTCLLPFRKPASILNHWYLIGQHLVTWPHLVARGAGKCLLADWQVKNKILLLRQKQILNIRWQLTVWHSSPNFGSLWKYGNQCCRRLSPFHLHCGQLYRLRCTLDYSRTELVRMWQNCFILLNDSSLCLPTLNSWEPRDFSLSLCSDSALASSGLSSRDLTSGLMFSLSPQLPVYSFFLY